MTSARDDILRRVASALPPDRPPLRRPAAPRQRPAADRLGRFVARVADYRAEVVVGSVADLARLIADAIDEEESVVHPSDLPYDVAAALATAVPTAAPDLGLSAPGLEAFDCVLTTARIGVAETGTVVLDHGAGQGRRMLTLLPDHHVCVVRADQVVDDVADALARLDPRRPQTWVSGPSATSDIELDRVEGEHGPRRLHVIVVT